MFRKESSLKIPTLRNTFPPSSSLGFKGTKNKPYTQSGLIPYTVFEEPEVTGYIGAYATIRA